MVKTRQFRIGDLVTWCSTYVATVKEVSNNGYSCYIQYADCSRIWVPADQLTLVWARAVAKAAYHAAKFDQGKRDYTLLPPDVVAELLDAEDALLEDDALEDADLLGTVSAVVMALMRFSATGELSHVFTGYVCSCDGRVVESLDGVVVVLEHGAKKYARDSWRGVPDASNRYFSACMRHLHAIVKGEVADADSKLPHWDHVRTNLMFLAGLKLAEVGK